MANRQPSFKAILATDYWSFLAGITIAVTWGVILLLSFFWAIPELLMDCCFGLTALCLIVLSVRISFLFTAFADGKEANATVCGVSFDREPGRIEYAYPYLGQNYQYANAVHRTKRARSFNVGDEVVVMVDPRQPKRAFIRDLYL